MDPSGNGSGPGGVTATDVLATFGVEPEDALQYGIIGMKWGKRRLDPSKPHGPTNVAVKTTPGKRVKAVGGTGQPPSEDAIKTAVNRQKAKASTSDALSTKELQELVTRWNLEQQYSKLSAEPPSRAKKFMKDFVSDERNALVKKGPQGTRTAAVVSVIRAQLDPKYAAQLKDQKKDKKKN